MDRWYMVFNEYPHGNRDIPFYFPRKLYAEFILGKHVNYFDILEFQGVGHGMTQDREASRTNPNHVPCPPCTPKPPQVYPPTGLVIDDIQKALFDLADTLLQHGTCTSEAGPSPTQDPPTTSPDRTRGIDRTGDAKGSERHVIPHP